MSSTPSQSFVGRPSTRSISEGIRPEGAALSLFHRTTMPTSSAGSIAIFYTALTLAVGVAMWIFSVLKFQADMGILLTFMFILNMIAAIIFLPALCRWILRPNEKDEWKPPHAAEL